MKLSSGKKYWGLLSKSARLSDDGLKEFYCIWGVGNLGLNIGIFAVHMYACVYVKFQLP